MTHNTYTLTPGVDHPTLTAARAREVAMKLWREELDCAQTIVKTFAELGVTKHLDTDLMVTLATGFGNGVGTRHCDCGALTGAIMVINAVFASQGTSARDMYTITGAFASEFKETYGTVTCGTIRKNRIMPCAELTFRTAENLAEFLAKRL